MAQSYRDSATRTEVFTGMLKDMNLLRSVSLDATSAAGEKTSMQGLLIVNEEAIGELTGEQLKQLADNGFLKPLFGHLASLTHLNRLSVEAEAEGEKADDKSPKKSKADSEKSKS